MDVVHKKLPRVRQFKFTWLSCIFWFSLVVCVFCTISCVRAFSNSTVNWLKPVRVYTMPNFVGKTADEVKESADFSKLTLKLVDEYSLEYPENTVLYQSVDADTQVTNNQTIILKVSAGEKQVVMPNLVGIKEKEALAQLDKLGIRYERVYVITNEQSTVDDDTTNKKIIPAGTVVATSIKASNIVKEDDTVKVSIERPYVEFIHDVPPCYNLSRDEAIRQLTAAGVTNYSFYTVASELPEGTVISAWPRGKVDMTTKIYVKVSGGPGYVEGQG